MRTDSKRFVVWWLALWAFYLSITAKTSAPELIAGLAAALLSTIALCTVWRSAGVRFTFAGSWWRPLGRMAGRVIGDCTLVLAANCKMAIHRSCPAGRIFEVEFDPGDSGAYSLTRRALVIAAGSFAPNSIVVLDPGDGRLLVHELITNTAPPLDKDWPL